MADDEFTKARASLTPAQLARLEETFQSYDHDKDGKVDLHEIAGMLHKLGLNPSIPELRAMISKVDVTTVDGSIDKEEFIKLMALRSYHHKKIPEETVRKIFQNFDTDKNNHISLQELRQVLRSLGLRLTKKELRQMIREADTNKDGQLNWEEFLSIVNREDEAIGKWSRIQDIAFFNSLWQPTPTDPKEREALREKARAEGKILKETTFVRHGLSQANWEWDQYQKDLFHYEPHLYEPTGIEQCQKAAIKMKGELEKHQLKLELIVVSPLYRAVQTATIVFAEQIAAGSVKVICHPLATELVTGSDDIGDSPQKIKEKWSHFPIDFSILEKEPEVWFWTPPGSKAKTIEEARVEYEANPVEEPWENCVDRAAKLEAWIAGRPENVIAVVAHGDFIEAMAGQDLDNATFWEMPIEERRVTAPSAI